jgi:signal transduction histidine kinase
VGIDPQHLARVFEQFWQGGGREFGRAEGLGLGLAIAQHIVHGHQGTLAAHSEGEGLGSVFTLRLPLLSPDLADA